MHDLHPFAKSARCQGGTLAEDHKHWWRAKFFQQYRLYFRYHLPSKVIVFAWVNDQDTKRAVDKRLWLSWLCRSHQRPVRIHRLCQALRGPHRPAC